MTFGLDMLRGDLEVAGDVPVAEILQVPGTGIIGKDKIVPDTGANKHFFHARYLADLFEELGDLPVTRLEGLARR